MIEIHKFETPVWLKNGVELILSSLQNTYLSLFSAGVGATQTK